MQPPRQVPGIARHRQDFSRASLPPVQSPLGQQTMPPAPNSEQEELAQEIYARLVVGKILDASYTADVDAEHMQELAKTSQAAARCYFAALG